MESDENGIHDGDRELHHFPRPEIQDNATGWGPCSVPDRFKDMPYQPFSKSDRLGKVADWTGQTYADKRLANKYQTQFGAGGQYAYFQEDDENTYQLVDTARSGNKMQRGKLRIGQRNMRNRNQKPGQNQMQVLPRGGMRGGKTVNQQMRGNRGGKQIQRKYDQKGQAAMKKREASVDVRSTWKIIEEMDFPRLSKLALPGIGEGQDIWKCGTVEFYDKTYDRVNCKNEKRLQRINRIFHKVTTTDDPIIRQLSKTEGNVYATDSILATLMCSTRSVISWDIVVQRVGNKLFFDKRDDSISGFDLLTVNETAFEPPYCDDEAKNNINWPNSLALEATFINHNFSQQVLRPGEDKFQFEHKNPFLGDDDEGEVASVAYRYRKFDLGENIELVVRCEHDGFTLGPNGEPHFINIKALNEWDPRHAGNGIDWRQKLDVQRGAVLANELKNNSCKLAKWTVQSLLASSDQIKFGYVSRIHVRDSSKHAILGTQQFKPKEFADQINLNMDNAWGILRCIIDTCMKLKEGKYLILKDPNKPTLLLYDIPDQTFETDEDDESNAEDEGEKST